MDVNYLLSPVFFSNTIISQCPSYPQLHDPKLGLCCGFLQLRHTFCSALPNDDSVRDPVSKKKMGGEHSSKTQLLQWLPSAHTYSCMYPHVHMLTPHVHTTQSLGWVILLAFYKQTK